MKLIRHFLAVSVAVGLIVGLGAVWSSSGAAGIVADDRGGRQRGAGGFSLTQAGDLVQTLVILALITAAVVAVDLVRRRHRRRPFPVGRPRTGA